MLAKNAPGNGFARRSVSKHPPEKYAALKAQGLNNVQIAAKLNVPETAVRRGLAKV